MKIKYLFSAATAALLLASCSGNEGKGLDAIKDATPGDSLVYYFGEMNASQYKQLMASDSTFATDKAKQAYLNGLKEGLRLFNADDEAYNRGVQQGIQMARNMAGFKKDHDIELNKNVYLAGVAYVLNTDSAINTNEIQNSFSRIMNDFSAKKEEKDKAASMEVLKKESARLKFPKINDVLYGTVTAKNDSAQIKDGDDVLVNLKFTDAEGKDLSVPLPSSLKVGARNLPTPINDALLALKSGETGKFVTTASSLFGSRATQFNLEPTSPVVMEIKASIEPKKDEK